MALTRVDIVLPGSVQEFWADEWDLHLQDEGRTLKIIAKGEGVAPRRDRDEALAADMVDGVEMMQEFARAKARASRLPPGSRPVVR